MYYLIHTPNYPRPYLSTVSFIANDFANWGCRVTCHTKNSPYITEIRYQEKRTRPAYRRTELLELWATEVLARKQQQSAPEVAQQEQTRKDRASAFVQDFVSSLSISGKLTSSIFPQDTPLLTCMQSPPPQRLQHCEMILYNSLHTLLRRSLSTHVSSTAVRTPPTPHCQHGHIGV